MSGQHELDAAETPRELSEIAKKVLHGEPSGRISVRELLRFFGALRRGYYIVQHIKSALDQLQIRTSPDFEDIWIDAEIEFVPAARVDAAMNSPETEEAGSMAPSITAPTVTRDATLRIGKLDPANQGVVSVKPNELIASAITKMLASQYSQLPVMTNERDLKGIISWFTIGVHMALREQANHGREVRHYMETAYEVKADEALFDALPAIVERGYVLVRGSEGTITGIVTASDLNVQFKQLAEPFLLLSEIERHIKNLIGASIPADDLIQARDPGDAGREIQRVGDLTLGEILRFLQNEANWGRLGLIGIDRKMFADRLSEVVKIRNDVMHFNVDPDQKEVVVPLQGIARFLQTLQRVRG